MGLPMSTNSHFSGCLRLTAFGGISVAHPSRPIGNAAGQRRPLAVLAILAVSGEQGVSRERLVSILWPDAGPERGRKALTQTLYSLRRATGADDLFEGVGEVRLNRAVVDCDVIEFDVALREHRLAEAADLYRGPFLEGFYVPGAGEFERWLENERTRWARRCADAVSELAKRAHIANDVGAEVEWCRKLVALDPLDSTSTLRLIDALGRMRDLVGAQRAAKIHEALVLEELDLPLAPEIRTRLQEIAADQNERGAKIVSPPEEGQAHGAVEPRAAASPQRGELVNIQRRLPSLATSAMATLLVIVALAAVGLTIAKRESAVADAQAALPLRENVIAILPFSIDTPDPAFAFLGEGSADLLSRILNAGDTPRAIDPGTVLSVLDSLAPQLEGSNRSHVGRTHARKVAKRLGAAEVMLGSVTVRSGRLAMRAILLNVASGLESAAADASGSADSLAAVVDALAARIVAQRTVGSERADAFAGAAFDVLKAYLRAEAAYHNGSYQAAAVLYDEALAKDSTFGPAALGLSAAADRLNSAEQHDRGLALAWAARDRLGTRDRAYLLALAGPRYPEPSPAAEHLAAWERAVALTPDRAAAWVELGERFLSDGALLGIRNQNARAEAAFRRALLLDPNDAAARRHLIEVAVNRMDMAALDSLRAGDVISRVGGELAGYLRWRVSIARGDSSALSRVRSRIPSMGESSLRAIAMASQQEGIALDDGARALRFLASKAALGAEQLDVLLAQHSLALNQGRGTLALEVTEQIQDAQPGSRSHLRMRVLDVLYGDGDLAAAVRAADELARVGDYPLPPSPAQRAVIFADVCVLAQWRAAPWREGAPARARANSRWIRKAITLMRSAPAPSVAVPVGASLPACADLTEAMLHVSLGSRDARAHVERLDAMMLTGPALGDASAWATLAVCRLFLAVGDNRRALEAVRQRPSMKGWPRYLASSLREEARLAQALGDSAGAARAAVRYATLRGQMLR
jgi:DNA-binding SARP family transcriptional activator